MIEQQSQSWREWRNRGIGSSEAPIIMGESPYLTPLEHWEIRTKRQQPRESNWAMSRGNEMEPKARASFELQFNIDMPPALVEYGPWPIARASLDGYNKELNVALEIKCCGKKNFELVKSGKVPIDYRAQIQHQILCSGVDKVYLWAFNGDAGAALEVYPDVDYCAKLLGELQAFWECIQKDLPPEASDKDYQVVSDPSLETYMLEWKRYKLEMDHAKTMCDELEQKIKSGLQVPRGICNGVRFSKSIRKGNIQYKNIKELQGLDLEAYRAAPTETFSMKILKETK